MKNICECGHYIDDHYEMNSCSYDYCYCKKYVLFKPAKLKDLSPGTPVCTRHGEMGRVERIRKSKAHVIAENGKAFNVRDDEFCIMDEENYNLAEDFSFILEDLIVASCYAEDLLEDTDNLAYCRACADFVHKGGKEFVIDIHSDDDELFTELKAKMRRNNCTEMFIKLLKQARDQNYDMIRLYSI